MTLIVNSDTDTDAMDLFSKLATKIVSSCIIVTLFVCGTGYGVSAQSAPIPEVYSAPPAIAALDKPLMIVRFNQNKVYFERQLYTVVSKALQIKPDVSFDVLTLVPVTGYEKRDEQYRKHASHSSDRVVAALQEIGIPSRQVERIYKESNATRHPEVHIFVQ